MPLYITESMLASSASLLQSVNARDAWSIIILEPGKPKKPAVGKMHAKKSLGGHIGPFHAKLSLSFISFSHFKSHAVERYNTRESFFSSTKVLESDTP